MPKSNLSATYLRKNEVVNIQIYSNIMAPCQTICIHMDPPKEIKFQRPTFNRKTFGFDASQAKNHGICDVFCPW